MKKKKKIKIIFLVLFVIVLIIVYIILPMYRKHKYGDVVRRAISMREAKKVVRENENYYIVENFSCSGGTEYEFVYGENRGKGVNLINGPYDDISKAFVNIAKNRFLIKGKSIKKIYESPYEVICPREYEIEVESYEFIAPIERDYTYTPHFRFFPPKTYIDEYDVEHGDYKL